MTAVPGLLAAAWRRSTMRGTILVALSLCTAVPAFAQEGATDLAPPPSVLLLRPAELARPP